MPSSDIRNYRASGCSDLVMIMTHRKDKAEEWAISKLQEIIDLDRSDSDALPGSVVRLIKQAQVIMKKRR